MNKSPSNNKNSYSSVTSLNDVLKTSNYESVLDPVPSSLGHSDLAEDDKVYRINLNILPVFFLEVLALGSLAALAYVLRFTTLIPVLHRGFFCNDQSISYPNGSLSDGLVTDVKPEFFYPVLLALPIGLILAGEIIFWLYSRKPRKVIRGGCIGCRLHQPLRRMLRFVGVFLLGLLTTSIITDSLKMSTGRLTPTFISVCDPINILAVCQEKNYLTYNDYNCSGDDDAVRNERLSFPSFHASTSAFAAVFTMAYIHWLMSSRSSSRFMLLPCLQGLLVTLALMCSALRVALNKAHSEDAFVGTILGTFVAGYLTYFVLNGFRERKHRRYTEDDLDAKPEAEIPPTSAAQIPSNLFFRYLRIPHVNYRNRSGRPYAENEAPVALPRQHENNLLNHMSVSKPPSLHEEFQRDLHQRIEDYVTKRPSMKDIAAPI